MNETPRLIQKYTDEIAPKMIDKFGYTNKMRVPKITKVVLNVGMGAGAEDIKLLESAADELGKITGQKAVITRARKAISNFKIRKGSPVGCKVTLRRKIMFEFLDRMLNIAIPRVKDFRGLPTNSFDQNMNYSFGLQEQIVFPEIEYDKVAKVHGMDITVVMTANTKVEAFELLKLIGFPFRK